MQSQCGGRLILYPDLTRACTGLLPYRGRSGYEISGRLREIRPQGWSVVRHRNMDEWSLMQQSIVTPTPPNLGE